MRAACSRAGSTLAMAARAAWNLRVHHEAFRSAQQAVLLRESEESFRVGLIPK